MLISFLVRSSCFRRSMQPVWEGLATDQWSDEQLEQLQAYLQSQNFVDHAVEALAFERSMGIALIDWLERKRSGAPYLFPGEPQAPPPFALAALKIAPKGWYQREKLTYCRYFDDMLNGVFIPAEGRIVAARAKQNGAKLENHLITSNNWSAVRAVVHEHRFAARMLLPSLGNVARHSAATQTLSQQGAIACALERYRHEHHEYPDHLAALAPKYIASLPLDVITGGLYQYRRQGATFILYSVGWDEKDDDGNPGKAALSDKGDWVWKGGRAALQN
jgi:hypothetical protein